MEKTFQIAALIAKELKGSATEKEQEQIAEWISQNKRYTNAYFELKNSKKQLSKFEVYQTFNQKKAWQNIENELFKTRTLIANKFIKYAAAILLPLLLAGSLTFWFKNTEPSSAIATIDQVVQPGSKKAMLVLSDGKQVELEESSNKQAIKEKSVNIKNHQNLLDYFIDEPEFEIDDVIFNELITPRGGGYNLKLADGTKVWLNAGSRLKYPVSFTDTVREVFLQGEGFFDVEHNGKPFIVNSNNVAIRVLGTSFNVSAYSDDTQVKTTLVEGKVKIDFYSENKALVQSSVLNPNQQAICSTREHNMSIETVNTNQYTSWMQGKLEFNEATLSEVMKRLARWYNFEYQFENEQLKNYHFTARINNSESISNVLEMLEMTTNVKFELKGNTIVIL